MQVAMLPWRYDADMGTANLLHPLALYGDYNERFGFGLLDRGSNHFHI